ncbi:MAG: T9SS type A sorting domain-containing protein [Methanococcaceae archaeon]
MRIKIILFLLSIHCAISAQTTLTIEGKNYTSSEDTWLGVNIPRDVPTRFFFRNNTISSKNRYGYLLQAGDEGPGPTNNNLDGAVITGNKFSWSGTDMEVIPHGLFTGHNRNVVAKYNYLSYVPMGIIRKSTNNMSNTGGGVAYNIVKGGGVAVVVKGMSNVSIYNNTLYTDRTLSETWRPLVHIYTNVDAGRYSVAHGTKIYNNIFYTKYQTFAITIDDEECMIGLECDYNVYWCETGSPRFSVNGSVKTFSQWQALGYDKHSVVVNPQFRDLVNFVPAKRLDYGKDLGSEWKDGLATTARWGTTDPATAAQNGTWQVGAVVYSGSGSPEPAAPVDTTGLSDINNRITVFPNPAREYIKIENLESSAEARVVKIFDFAGKLCEEITIGSGDKVTLPIDLRSGMYILRIEIGTAISHIQKLMIIK